MPGTLAASAHFGASRHECGSILGIWSSFVWEDVVDGSEGDHDQGEGGAGGVEAAVTHHRQRPTPWPSVSARLGRTSTRLTRSAWCQSTTGHVPAGARMMSNRARAHAAARTCPSGVGVPAG
jgi:hypothetical protein